MKISLILSFLFLSIGSSFAAIARTQAVSANANTVTLSSTTSGDVILVFAYRGSGTGAPALPAGYTSLANVAASGNSGRLFYKISTGGDTSSGTATNATQTVALVYSGADQTTPVTLNGNALRNGASSTTMQMTAFASMTNSGNSWIAGFVGAASVTAGMNSNTAALTNRTNVTTEAGFDTGAATTNIANQTFTVTTASASLSILVEILPAAAPTPTATATALTNFLQMFPR